jgi:gamma-glutamylputrescine oxidase
VLALAGDAAARGARIAEGSPALAVEEGEQMLVRTAAARVRASHVVLAANFGNAALAPEFGPKILPAATYMIATAPLGAARAAALVRDELAVADSNYVLDYFRPSADGRLLFGGGISYAAAAPPALARRLRRRMLRVFPQLADIPVEHAWSGTIDLTRSRLPQLGRRGPGTWFAHGFSGHGIALAVLAGRLIAEAIDGETARFDALSRLARRAFPGGPRLRVPIVAAGALWYRLRDLIG